MVYQKTNKEKKQVKRWQGDASKTEVHILPPKKLLSK